MHAANDPERFCWPSFGDIARHATNWKADPSGGPVYTERHVQRALRLLEQLGILLPMTRKRSGRERSGWIVTRHATPPEWKRCNVPSIGLTYRSNPKAKKISTANVSGGKRFVSANVSAPEGFVSGQSGECVRECVRSEESQVPKVHPVDADGHRVLPPVSRGLTFNEPSKPIFSASEERSRKEREPVTRSDPAVASPVENLKVEGPERVKAKAFFEVKPEIQKASLSTFGQVVVHFANEGLPDLSEITKKSLEYCKTKGLGFAVPEDAAGFVKRILRRKCANA
jgi:hypothetical protein